MSIPFDQFMERTDTILSAQGLYQTVTFVDTTVTDESYDPITGEYTTTSSTTFTFNAVVLSETASNETDNQYGITLDIIVVARNLTFTPEVDQIYIIGGVEWQVINSSLAPQSTIYTIALGRK